MLKLALSHYGINKMKNEPFMRELHQEVDIPYNYRNNWCGMFMAYIARKACYEVPGTAEVARKWLKVGTDIAEPQTGDLAIFWRISRNSWQGHVGIYLREYGDDRVYILGGNQGAHKAVCVQPYYKKALLGYRRLAWHGRKQ